MHQGLSFYTLGQRQGLGIGGVKAKGAELKAIQALGQRGVGEHTPWFVARKDMEKNTLWVVQGHDHPWLQSHALTADNLSWVAGHAPITTDAAALLNSKTRYRQADASCTLVNCDVAGNTFELTFPQPQWAVTPGQSAVLYDGDVCLGGGIISGANA
jgi:tRNA-uridine 2-sulfurtransferase